MRYGLEQISDDDFEKLVLVLCQKILGIGVQGFAKGRDGGVDARFSGKANSYPSESQPWDGLVIIQAKHTQNSQASCSDGDFFNNNSSIIKTEINKLKNNGTKLDYYMLFTNRKQPAASLEPQLAYIKQELGVKGAAIFGLEKIESILDSCQDIVKQFRLLRYILPEYIYPEDIKQVIITFAKNKDLWKNAENNSDTNDLLFVSKEEKNRLNNVSEYYFDNIKEHSLRYFSQIDEFLKDPINEEYKEMYENTTSDLRSFLMKNRDLKPFVDLLEDIIEQIKGFDETQQIFKERRFVSVFVHYMYFNCDIGRKK